jgi:hypothetical protein
MRRRQLVATIVSGAFLLPLVFLVLGALRTPGTPAPTGLEVLVPELRGAGFARAVELGVAVHVQE